MLKCTFCKLFCKNREEIYAETETKRDFSRNTTRELSFKGTVSRDFSPPVFSLKLLLLVPLDKSRNDSVFFRLFAEIFDYFGASPVSMTLAKHTLPASLTPVRNFSPASLTLVSDAFSVLKCFTAVNDTAE